jgi:serine/threonine-protein kinase HipA
LKLTSSLGLTSANVAIADFNGNRVLVVERFDRLWTRARRLLRLPQEDCCQSLSAPPTRKYESDGGLGMAAILNSQGQRRSEADQRLFLKAQSFLASGAPDGHAKNFSVFLRPGGCFRLTPLYDVM